MEATAAQGLCDVDLVRSLGVEETQALLRSAAHTLDAVDRALAALDDGTYGECAVCGEPLPEEQLVLDPSVSECPAHETARPFDGVF